MANTLEQLKKFTTVVADTGDINRKLCVASCILNREQTLGTDHVILAHG